MTILPLSDLHGYLPNLKEYSFDCITISGDIFPIEFDRNLDKCQEWWDTEFNPWLKDYKNVVLIFGNHDFLAHEVLEKGNTDYNLNVPEHVHILHDSGTTIDDITFYGTPWVPNLKDWPFYADSKTLEDKFKKIPEGLDVLLTHTPPDVASVGTVLDYTNRYYGHNLGSKELLKDYKYPRFHFFGHIHSGDPAPVYYGDSKLINVSVLDEQYYSKILYYITEEV